MPTHWRLLPQLHLFFSRLPSGLSNRSIVCPTWQCVVCFQQTKQIWKLGFETMLQRPVFLLPYILCVHAWFVRVYVGSHLRFQFYQTSLEGKGDGRGLCARTCMRACVRVCVRACVRACVSRVMSVRLKFSDRERFRIFSAHAPTFSSPCNIKEEFYETLQAALRDVEGGEKCIMLGDFNAQIGSREFGIDTDDPWWEVRVPHGFGMLNSSGRELLNFFSSNNATVCNT